MLSPEQNEALTRVGPGTSRRFGAGGSGGPCACQPNR